MSRTARWLTTMTVFALSAGMLAAGLLWMLITRPIALAAVLGRIW